MEVKERVFTCMANSGFQYQVVTLSAQNSVKKCCHSEFFSSVMPLIYTWKDLICFDIFSIWPDFIVVTTFSLFEDELEKVASFHLLFPCVSNFLVPLKFIIILLK